MKYLEDLEQRYGRIQDVRGDDATVEDDHATARVTLRTDRSDTQIQLHLARENNLWKVDLTGR